MRTDMKILEQAINLARMVVNSSINLDSFPGLEEMGIYHDKYSIFVIDDSKFYMEVVNGGVVVRRGYRHIAFVSSEGDVKIECDMREVLRDIAQDIAANKGEAPASPTRAFSKLFVQEKRDWQAPGKPRIGWKRGELFEVAQAAITGGDWRSEWGDVGYYVAQTWDWLWWLYEAVTPTNLIEAAVEKFERRTDQSVVNQINI